MERSRLVVTVVLSTVFLVGSWQVSVSSSFGEASGEQELERTKQLTLTGQEAAALFVAYDDYRRTQLRTLRVGATEFARDHYSVRISVTDKRIYVYFAGPSPEHAGGDVNYEIDSTDLSIKHVSFGR
jgi:hypothetical protein